MQIDSFHDQYRFLSNFYPAHVHAIWNDDKVLVGTVEHAFQAAKAMNRSDFDKICIAKSPGEAKRLGKRIVLRSAWEAVRLSVMESLLVEKFNNPVLGKQLLATRDVELIEGNRWGDVYWGVCKGVGENHLGKLLMKVRAGLIDGLQSQIASVAQR